MNIKRIDGTLLFIGVTCMSALPLEASEPPQSIGVPSISTKAPPNDPYLSPTPGKRRQGKVVYGSYQRQTSNQPYLDQYLTVRDLRPNAPAAMRLKTLRVPVISGLWIYSPKFSPDGKKVLFRVGEPMNPEQVNYVFYVWDIESGQVLPGPKTVLHEPELRWSDDSNKVSYLKPSEVPQASGKGTPRGNNGAASPGLDVYNYDLNALSGKRVQIGVSPYVDWAGANTQIFTKETIRTLPQPKGTKGAPKIVRTVNILQRDTQGNSKALIANATDPQISPDNNFILFQQVSPRNQKSRRALLDVRKQQVSILPATFQKDANDDFKVLPQGNIVVAKQESIDTLRLDFLLRSQRSTTVRGTKGRNKARVTPPTRRTLTLRRKNPVPTAPQAPRFKVLPQPKSHTRIITQVQTYGTLQNGLRDSYLSLEQVDAITKSVDTIAKFKNATGVDSWRVEVGE